jgi:hypothetical protein
MRSTPLLATLLLCTSNLFAQLQGAWKLVEQNGRAISGLETIKLYGDTYFMFAEYTTDGKFKKAGGGAYTLIKDYTETMDFFTFDSTQVGKTVVYTFKLKDNRIMIEAPMHDTVLKETWERIDNLTTPLTGVWRFGARLDENDKEVDKRRGPGPRQTIKLLSGRYFQWVAFNTQTKEFLGTGGGEYVLNGDNYAEKLRFFSRDDSRVGKELIFSFKTNDNDWFHKGKSSTGGIVDEVWEKMK